MPHPIASPPKKPHVKDEAWRRAALRYSLLAIILGVIGGTYLGLQIARVEGLEAQGTTTEEAPQKRVHQPVKR